MCGSNHFTEESTSLYPLVVHDDVHSTRYHSEFKLGHYRREMEERPSLFRPWVLWTEETKQKLGTGLAGSLARPTQASSSSKWLPRQVFLRSTPLNVLLVSIFDDVESFTHLKLINL